jgi:hypothetical protein
MYTTSMIMASDRNERLIAARRAAGFKSAAAAARRFHWTLSTYCSHENGQTKLPQRAAEEYARAFKVLQGPAWLLGLIPAPGVAIVQNVAEGSANVAVSNSNSHATAAGIGDSADGSERMEGELIDPAQIRDGIGEQLAAIVGHRQLEIWRLTTDNLAAAGYRGGDYCVVDRSRKARADDIVLAEAGGATIFRKYVPPFLFMMRIGPAAAPELEDKIATFVRGVVISNHRL